MNSKIKGFTLIELLAVIVILAIIALIITPIITGVIKKAKDSADLRSAEAYVKAGENYYAKASTSGGTLDSNVIDDLEVSSNKATDGSSVVVNSDGTTDMAIIIDDKCYRKTFSESIKDIKVTDITNDEDRNACNVPLKSDYAFLSKTISDKVGYKYFSGNGFLKNEQIKSISVAETVPSTYQYSWEASDTSLSNNASIMAYAVGNDTDNYDLYLVSSKPIASPIDSSKLFENMNLTGDVNLSWLNTYFTTNMSYMFADTGSRNMASLTLGDNFNAQNVTDMSYMFDYTGCNAMTTLNLGNNFNAKSALNMSYMFHMTGGNVIKSLDLGENFNAESATDMNHMFYDFGVQALSTFNLGDNFNSKNVTDMSYMFSGSGMRALETFNLGSSFYTSNVTNMSWMFFNFGYSALTTLNLGSNFDTSNVIDMSYMFLCMGSNKLTTLNLGDKFDTSNVINMSLMFEEMAQNTTTFEELNLGDKFDTSNVTNMKSMFNQMGRNSLKKLSLGDKFNTSKVTDMRWMFGENNTMTELDLGPAFKNVTSDIDFGWHSNTLTVKVSSDIYSDATHLKLNKDSGTTITVSSTSTLVSTY